MKRINLTIAAACFLAAPLSAKLAVVATTTDLQALTQAIAGDFAKVSVLCPPGGDPHYLEAKPSQIIMVRDSEMLVCNGAELETGWLPLLLRGARRDDLQEGGTRFFDASLAVELLEVPAPGSTRAEGDVHAMGNPHFMLDPLRASKVGLALAEKLAQLDPGHADSFRAAAAAFDAGMQSRVKDWKERVARKGIKKVVAYHKDLNYLLGRLGLEPGAYIEPKPGLPPTARHLALLVDTVKSQGIKLAVISHFYPTAPAEKLASSVPGFRWVRVPGQVGAMKGAEDLPGLYEMVVAAMERQ